MRPPNEWPRIGPMPSLDARRPSRPTFMIECYWPGVTERDFHDHAAILDSLVPRGAASAAGPVVHLGSMLVLEDEVILSLFHAPGVDQLRVLLAARSVAPDRILVVTAVRGRRDEPGLRA
jgi:hypothetical protein